MYAATSRHTNDGQGLGCLQHSGGACRISNGICLQDGSNLQQGRTTPAGVICTTGSILESQWLHLVISLQFWCLQHGQGCLPSLLSCYQFLHLAWVPHAAVNAVSDTQHTQHLRRAQCSGPPKSSSALLRLHQRAHACSCTVLA